MLDLRAPSAAPRPSPRKWDLEANPASSFGISNLAWAPDSRHLLVVWRATELGIHVLDTRTQASLEGSPRLELRDTNRLWNTICCYLSNNKFVDSSVQRDRSTVWTFDATGARQNRLMCCGTVLSTDRVDHALLINFTNPKHVGGIYRWSVGDHRPAYLGSLFATAAWVPANRRAMSKSRRSERTLVEDAQRSTSCERRVHAAGVVHVGCSRALVDDVAEEHVITRRELRREFA
jgi:hypothetical protein